MRLRSQPHKAPRPTATPAAFSGPAGLPLAFGGGLSPEPPATPHSSTPSSFLADAGRGVVDPLTGYRYVLADRPIVAGEVVAVFGGTVITRAQLDALGPEGISRCLQVEEGLYLYSTVDGPGDWINHSCAPNLELCGQVVLVAARDIEAGEELCFDYATADGSAFDEFPCRCGAPECRGRVSGEDWERALDRAGPSNASPYLQQRLGVRRSGVGGLRP